MIARRGPSPGGESPHPSGDNWWLSVLASQRREQKRLIGELSKIKGLMPLLMKRRNGNPWIRTERKALRQQLAALAHLSPYIAIMVLPGSFIVVPILAWWLDRRRAARRSRPP